MKWLYILFSFPLLCFSQNSAFFETSIFFEDSMGNKDTIIVGHDELANNDFNPTFGEVNISEPWDSTFEVRAAHYLDWQHPDGNLLLSKKIIGSNEGGINPNGNCLSSNEPIIFFAKIQHLPLAISWDNKDFSKSLCRNWSTLTPNVTPMISQFWYEYLVPNIDYSCMAEDDYVEFSDFSLDDGFGFYLIDDIEGLTQDTMVGILLHFRPQGAVDTPCFSIVSATNEQTNIRQIEVYPNPTKDLVNINNVNFDYWLLLNKEGKLIKRGNDSKIDMSVYNSRQYYLSFINSKGMLIQTKKIIKIE